MNILQYLRQTALIAVGLVFSQNGHAEEIPDSVDTYNNQSVATEIIVQGRTLLTSQGVTVTNIGQLTLNGPAGVYIPQDFEVKNGGSLQINGGLQYVVSFLYDASGNRIRRQKKY